MKMVRHLAIVSRQFYRPEQYECPECKRRLRRIVILSERTSITLQGAIKVIHAGYQCRIRSALLVLASIAVRRRIHQALAYRSPAEVYIAYYKRRLHLTNRSFCDLTSWVTILCKGGRRY